MLINTIAVVLSYMVLGAGLKYIDEVYDVHIFNKRTALALSLLCGTVMGATIAFDPPSQIILTSIIISVILARKIDNKAFATVVLLSAIIPLGLVLFTDLTLALGDTMLYSILFLVILGVSDELLDAIGDKKQIKVLTMRPLMKLGVILLAFYNVFDYVYLIAFLGFDLAYMLVHVCSSKIVLGMTHLEIKSKGVVPEHL